MEIRAACPFYLGEETSLQEPIAVKNKRFNPVIDMISERMEQSRTLDIEDLVTLGKMHSVCPYYLQKSRLASADILIMPYQYILQSDLRRQLQINLRNAIIVFDQAHRIEEACEESMSFDVVIEQFWEAFRYLDTFSKHKKGDSFNDFMLRK